MNASVVAAIIAAIFGTGGVVALLKVRAESGSIVVSAAEKVLEMQEKTLQRKDQTIRRLEKELRTERQERQISEKHFLERLKLLEGELERCMESKGALA